MTSILNLSGLNYGASNPLRMEMNIIRDNINRVERSMKELAAGGAGGGSLTGAKGITAGLKEVALQIVNMRSEIETLKSSVNRIELSADTHQKRVDKAIADLTSRMTMAETTAAATSSGLKSLKSTVSSLSAAGAQTTISTETISVAADNVDLLSAITEAIAEAEAETDANTEEAAPVTVTEAVTEPVATEANAQEDEAASEEILALLRSPTA